MSPLYFFMGRGGDTPSLRLPFPPGSTPLLNIMVSYRRKHSESTDLRQATTFNVVERHIS